MRLAWKVIDGCWATVSAEGSTARVARFPEDAETGLVIEVVLGDAKHRITPIIDTRMTRRDIIDEVKDQAEGFLLRYESTGIKDPYEANEAISRMPIAEWSVRFADWRAKNRVTNAMIVSVPRFVHRGFQIDTNRIKCPRWRGEHESPRTVARGRCRGDDHFGDSGDRSCAWWTVACA